jgi:hypothetical protein
MRAARRQIGVGMSYGALSNNGTQKDTSRTNTSYLADKIANDHGLTKVQSKATTL